ncbi:hypothetical protein AWC38_SpisGene8274 [Stylophora pistillata]|uniref:Uncharacterized protein n=1 Tax=Stylophora pistillata TaxID=50429 RepID=A0A2B4SET1_STYPI|nr:hypothetical protein AWC38_SpisGene8274 [Stylophora pistillata]
MTAKLIASILFLILILEIFPNRSAAIGSGPNESCKSGSPVCKQKILKAHLEDKKSFQEDVFGRNKRRICDIALRMGCGQSEH